MASAGSEPPSEALLPSRLLQAVRGRFLHADGDPFSGDRTYLENAGGGLTLRSALEADAEIAALPDNAGRQNASSAAVGRVLQAGRDDLRIFFNAPDGTILSEQSTTSCAFRLLSAAAAGVRGTNIVCSKLDHASFFDAASVVANRHGLERRAASFDRSTGALDPSTFASLVDEGTVAVSVIHASNITGGRTRLREVVECIRTRAPRAIIIADGAQHVQHGLVDVAAAGVDAYVFSAYKAFSRPGFAFACLSPRLALLPHAQLLGKPSSDWDLGTRDPGGFAAFSRVVDYLCWLGREAAPETVSGATRRDLVRAAYAAIEAHESALSRLMVEGDGKRAGLRMHPRVTLHGQQHHSKGREAVFAFSIDGVPTEKLVREFGRRRIVVHDRVSDAYSRHTLEELGIAEVVRVSLAHYTTPGEVARFLEALDSIVAGL